MWYILTSAVTKGIGVITTPIFTRLLSGEEYGGFALYMTLLGGASVICSAFNSGSALYKGLKENETEKESYLRATLLSSTLFSLLICLLLFTFSPFLELKLVFYIPLSLQLLCDGITAVFLSSARFYYKYRAVAAVGIISAALPPLISVGLLTRSELGYSVRIYSLLLVSIFVALYSLMRLLKYKGLTDKKIFLKEAAKNSLPMLPHSISSALTAQADKLIISSLLGTVALGKYSVVYSIGSALLFIVNAIGSALSPWIIRRLKANEKEKIATLVQPMTLGFCALMLCLIAIAPEAMSILAPRDYFEAFPALLPIALSTPFYFLSTVATVGIVYSGQTSYSLIISTVSAIGSVILNYTLTSVCGYFGAGLAVMICQAVSAVLGISLLYKTKASGMISSRGAAILILASIPLAALISSLEKYLIYRGLTLIIPAAMLFYCLTKAKKLVLEKT